MWFDQCVEALFNRIGTGPLLAKPIGVFVSSGFQHGIERQQMQCLVASIFHGRNSQRAFRFSVRFQYVHTSERLRLIASALKCMYCLCLHFWCVPNFLVDTRSFLAIVFRHSSNSENFAAIRVSQQALQGSHPAPSADLRCLRDTHLESANVTVDGLPVNGIPFRRFARDRTNGCRHRHLLCLLCRFASFSRVKHLREVGSLSRPVLWSMRLTQPVSAPLRSSLRFLPDCCPHRHRSILRCTSPCYRGAVWIY